MSFNKLQSFQLKFSVSASAQLDLNVFKNTSGIFDNFGNGEKSKKKIKNIFVWKDSPSGIQRQLVFSQ